MKSLGGARPREDGRHWLPSQGVDPAPLAELNAECLGRLVIRAAECENMAGAPPLLLKLHSQWAALPSLAVKRLAAAPYCLFDAGFASASRWIELRARGVNDLPACTEPAFFDGTAARSISRRMLVYGWHLARSRPRAACLVFGTTLSSVQSLAACSLVVLEATAERNADALRPRWPTQFGFWKELLVAASDGADRRLHELLLGGVQRLAADTLAAHSP